jgi:predicted anti-sigma-YlaC factor YlaD
MPSCREVARTISTDSLERKSLPQRMIVFVHIMMCRHCRRYLKQMRAIGQAAREVFRDDPGDQETLDRLREHLRRATSDEA